MVWRTHKQTWALAQLLKRLRWDMLRAYALDDNEAYQLSYAVYKLQKALARAGVAPR